MSKNPKNQSKLMIIADIDREFFISSERLKGLQWNFQERCDLCNINSHKKVGFYPLFRRYIFGKPTGGEPPAVLGLTSI